MSTIYTGPTYLRERLADWFKQKVNSVKSKSNAHNSIVTTKLQGTTTATNSPLCITIVRSLYSFVSALPCFWYRPGTIGFVLCQINSHNSDEPYHWEIKKRERKRKREQGSKQPKNCCLLRLYPPLSERCVFHRSVPFSLPLSLSLPETPYL